jgi:hypothetical protein
LELSLLHLAAAGDQVHEDTQERHDDQEDAPQSLDPAVQLGAGKNVDEARDQDPDPNKNKKSSIVRNTPPSG